MQFCFFFKSISQDLMFTRLFYIKLNLNLIKNIWMRLKMYMQYKKKKSEYKQMYPL